MTDHLERVARVAEAVRRSREVHKDGYATRNNAMLEANDAGHSIGAIARASGHTRPAVRKMITTAAVARQEEHDQDPTTEIGS